MAGTTRRTGRIATLAVTLAVASMALAAQADAFVYWGKQAGDLSRANLDGSGADPAFAPAGNACAVAVDGNYLYWVERNGTAIGRVGVDGTGANPSFIDGITAGCGLDVDAEYVYWADDGTDAIGRANLDGSGANPSFITTPAQACGGVAVTDDAIYWMDEGVRIGRAQIDGSNPDASIIDGSFGANCGEIAVNGARVYFPNGLTTVGRANLDGSAYDDSFVEATGFPCGVEVDGDNVYWGLNAGGLGRADLDGSNPDNSFISASGADPCGLAVDELIRPTATAVSCAPVQVASFQPVRCEATITDTGNGLKAPPAGTVAFTSSDTNGGYASGSTCTLAPRGADSASCSVGYSGSRTANLLGFYEGDEGAYSESSGFGGFATSSFALGAVTRNVRKGTATVGFTAPGPGAVNLSGKGLRPASVNLPAATSATLPVRGNRQLRKRLKRRGKAPVTVQLGFVPQGGGAEGLAEEPITLQRKVKKKRRRGGGRG